MDCKDLREILDLYVDGELSSEAQRQRVSTLTNACGATGGTGARETEREFNDVAQCQEFLFRPVAPQAFVKVETRCRCCLAGQLSIT